MMELNERQWQAGMNFRIDAPDLSDPAFEASLAEAQSRRRELTTRGLRAVVSRIDEDGQLRPLHA